MRKLVIAAALALAAGGAGAGEATAQQQLIGVKAGFVSANVDEDGADARTTFGFGGFVQLPVAQNLSLQPEVLYLGKGFASEADGVDATFELTYVQVPLLLQYHFPVEGSVSPRLFAGPAVAFELACDVSGSDGSTNVSLSCDDFADFGFDLDTKSADFGLTFGAGVDIAAGSATVTLDGRYDMGLSEIVEFEGVSGLKNRAWEFFAGVGLPFGG